MNKRKVKLSESLFYILGIFATIQLLSIAGVTVFNILLLMAVIFPFILILGRIKIDKFFVLSIISTVFTISLSLSNGLLTKGFKQSAIIGGITYLGVLILYIVMNTKPQYAEKLIKGIKVSCILTLCWCCLQLVFYYLFNIDLNKVIFGELFKIVNAKGDYYNGKLIPSGFYYHRAILMPSLIFLFFSTTNPYLMLLIIIIGCLTRSTALIIGLLLALGSRVFISNAGNLFKTINKKQIILILTIMIIVVIDSIMNSSQIEELAKYIYMRFADTMTNKADNSSVVHFLYYRNLESILKNMNIKNILFGTGFGTSGQHYTWFNGQYAGLESWVVESDYINILLNQGVIGLILWGFIFIKLVILSKKYKYWENIAFIFVIAFVGIMYNIQFTWFIIAELGMYILTKNEIRVFKVNSNLKSKG